ncbi:MAG: heme exporter protein CcmD [Henriciella sp.]|uniref:heme exporter protein CcmD n=1 Tax=Henriciella sp. TaxID=1968823 RepID=UPI003C73E3D8
MLPAFDDNAAFIWVIYAIGLSVPALLLGYAALRANRAKRKLERLQAETSR